MAVFSSSQRPGWRTLSRNPQSRIKEAFYVRFFNMFASGKLKRVLRILCVLLLLYGGLVLFVYVRQRSLLFFPTHQTEFSGSLKPWMDGTQVIGFCHEVTNPHAIWLMTHGNGGQAANRD